MLAALLVLALHADAGGFADAFALDGAGGRLAIVRVDARGASELQVLDLAQRGAVLARARLAAPPTALTFTRGGLLASTGATATLYDDAGRLRARFGPATAVVAGDERIAVYDRGRAEVALYDPERPQRPLVRRALGKLDLEPRYWRAGYTRLIGRRAGRYDPRLDRRLPDVEVEYDVEKGTAVERPPGDPRVARERAARPNQECFIAGDVIITADDRIVPLGLPDSPADAEAGPDGQLFFAVGDDLYRFDPDAGLAKIASLGGALRWHVAGGRVALLDHGVDLRVLDLAR